MSGRTFLSLLADDLVLATERHLRAARSLSSVPSDANLREYFRTVQRLADLRDTFDAISPSERGELPERLRGRF